MIECIDVEQTRAVFTISSFPDSTKLNGSNEPVALLFGIDRQGRRLIAVESLLEAKRILLHAAQSFSRGSSKHRHRLHL